MTSEAVVTRQEFEEHGKKEGWTTHDQYGDFEKLGWVIVRLQNAKTLSDWEDECKQLIPKHPLKLKIDDPKWKPYDALHLAKMVRVSGEKETKTP